MGRPSLNTGGWLGIDSSTTRIADNNRTDMAGGHVTKKPVSASRLAESIPWASPR
jgi:hypothetical protein